MKNLKVKLTQVSLVAICFVALFVQSCTQVELVTPEESTEINDVMARFEADPILDEVKEITEEIYAISQSQMNDVNISYIVDRYEGGDEEALQEVFTDVNLSALVLRHRELSLELQEKYPSLYQGIDVSNDIETGLNNIMAMSDRNLEDRCRRPGWYWVCVTAVGSPTFVCIVTTLPSIALPVLCTIGYTAAVAMCADTYCR